MQKKYVGISGGPERIRYQPLLDALCQLFPVEFRALEADSANSLDALLVLDGNLAAGLAAAAGGVPSYVAVAGEGMAPAAARSEVRFGSSALLDECLRNQVLMEEDRGSLCPLQLQPGDEILAVAGENPVWLSRPAARSLCQIVGTLPPLLDNNEFLFQHLSGRRFMRLLPLLNFLRQQVKDINWHDAPPGACFVFDDPSLYRPSYGFLNYRLLAEQAAKHNFFVSVATIPLDTWWVNGGVAETFRSCSPRLSLLIHGNNHTFGELVWQGNGTRHLALAAQAMQRMDRLENKHRIPFLKIMEAPHGLITNELFEHLLALGYEAALGSAEWLVRCNPHIAWPSTVGLDRSELLGGGLPVIPRIRMSPDWKNEVLLAAFLRQPIVLVGHHYDATDQLKLLTEFAQVVNNLNHPLWASPLGIARSNYREFRQGDILNLKVYSRRIQLSVPEGIKHLLIHRPWLHDTGNSEMLMVRNATRELWRAIGGEIVGPVSVAPAEALEIVTPPPNPVDYRALRAPRIRCWPVLRKVLMEVRDRSAPARYQAMKWLCGSRAEVPGKHEPY